MTGWMTASCLGAGHPEQVRGISQGLGDNIGKSDPELGIAIYFA